MSVGLATEIRSASAANCKDGTGSNACDTDAGTGSTVNDICTATSTTITCELDRISDSNPATAYAILNSTSNEYNVFGYEGSGSPFCCAYSASGRTTLSLHGTSNDDVIDLNYMGDKLDAYNMNFAGEVFGRYGEDSIYGSTSTGGTYTYVDRLHGDQDDDFIDGQAGDDQITGDNDEDELHGGEGMDTIDGGNQDDFIDGEAGVDTLYGGDGVDFIYGGTGGDIINGGNGNDNLHGQDDNDTIYGNDDDDDITAGNGSDHLYGEGGTEDLYDQCSYSVYTGKEGVLASRPTECPATE